MFNNVRLTGARALRILPEEACFAWRSRRPLNVTSLHVKLLHPAKNTTADFESTRFRSAFIGHAFVRYSGRSLLCGAQVMCGWSADGEGEITGYESDS
jgi:hypothetical protein